ncbi:hypothetical protein QR77_16625 [Streptomyces sp. 150FB]|nr:hypothetical protein QR77_16625 [Streptomyces sp. 150FB]
MQAGTKAAAEAGMWVRARAAVRRAKRTWTRRLREDAGMATAEYAVATVAACAFAALLYKVVTSDQVSAALESMIGKALNVSF